MDVALEHWQPIRDEYAVDDFTTITKRLCMCQLTSFECGVTKVVRNPKLNRIN
jgi:predicted nucleotide-binding protein (sugar kinase/HSP70/actin superfamily)